MKILYGVQGTGNGHVTRARHMAESFAKQSDLQVDYLFSGRAPDAYFDMQAFLEYKTRRGFTFVTESGQIKHAKTLVKNNVLTFAKNVSALNIKDYDLLINDFEPVSAWAAKKAGIPSLSVSHQAAFLHHVPRKNQSLIDKVVTRCFAPTQYTLGTHWYHFGYNIIPPVVARDLVAQARSFSVNLNTHSQILVYLPFESL